MRLDELAQKVGDEAAAFLHAERPLAEEIRRRAASAAAALAFAQLEALARPAGVNAESVAVARARLDNLGAAGAIELRASVARAVQSVLIRGIAAIAKI